jgi:hypothetical protein
MKKPLTVLLFLLVVANFIQAQPFTIGYTNCVAVTNYPQSVMDQIGQLKWYFAHASIGECIMEGVTNLHLANPGFFQLQGFNATNTPPATNQPGTIYQDARGNPQPFGNYQAKIDYFATAVSNGWHYPFVNLALNKFCYIDIWLTAPNSNAVVAEFNSYLNSMTNLEAAFPQTVFIYATMPVTATNSPADFVGVSPVSNDYWRNVFNDSLRTWCATNNRPLFDIADIETHDTNGNTTTFTFTDGGTYQQLWFGNNQGGDQPNGEVGDGAHPTNFGAEARMAQGLYALAAAIINPSPLLKAISVSGGTATVAWNALPGHTYRLQYKPSPFAGDWENVLPDVLAHGPTATVTNAPANADGCFYRVRLVQ